MTLALHDYQETARDHLLANPGAGLFLDMGLGKTAITLSALTSEHLPALVVAPKRVARITWPKESAKWRPDLSIEVSSGSPGERAAALARRADITVISRDTMAEAIGGDYRTLVLDELSAWKTPGTARSKAARALSKRAPHVWGLTGTPAPRSLDDLYHQVGLLDGGKRLGTSQERFRKRFYTPMLREPGSDLPPGGFITTDRNGTLIEWTPKPGSEAAITALVGDICLSMGAVEGMVPPSVVNPIPLELPTEHRKHYRTLVRDLLVDIELLGIVSAANAAVVTNKLSQLTAGFLYDEDGTTLWLHDTKIEALEEVIEGAGSPVLVFYRYKAEAAAIRARFPEAKGIDDFGALEDWDRGELPIMLAHPASAGHGLNLQDGGHTICWTSLDWSLELWQQANARLARQGQKHPVVIHVLDVENSIDGVIRSRLDGKEITQSSLLRSLRRQS